MSNLPGLQQTRVAVVGLGLMGGSLALALQGRCLGVDGVDQDTAAVEQALEMGAIQRGSADPVQILPQAGLVILATPVLSIIDYLGRLPELHPGAPVVMDLGSTKVEIMAAMERLPLRFEPVGGHPMCGKEKLSIANAEAGLFRGAAFVISCLPRTTTRALLLAQELAQEIGARPLYLEPEVHDRWTAATSHFPYLVSTALAGSTPLEVEPLVASGFRSTARLAGTAPRMMVDILLTNRQNLLARIHHFQGILGEMEKSLETNDIPGLQQLLEMGAASYEDLVAKTNRGGG